jgi:hypothetical protein
MLAGSMGTHDAHEAQDQRKIDSHYETIRAAMWGAFQELGVTARYRQSFFPASPSSA